VENGKVTARQPADLIKLLHPTFSSFHFNFSSNHYGSSPQIMYRYQLEGFDHSWSNWHPKSEKDYTNLPYGSYTFMVQARDYLGHESGIYTYQFEIKPRWYQTWYARIGYILLGLMMILMAGNLHQRRLNRQRERFEKEEQQLKYLHELELEHNEKEIIQLRNERLETEVLYKNRELAAMTMHLYKRGRILTKIKEELSEATQMISVNTDRTSLNKLLKMIAEEEKREGDWEQFSVYFDEVHNSFLQKLKARYENLSPTDLKMSAYIKMNLSAKEIAQLMNITIKGVEIARYRLKKKLEVPADLNLNTFINNFN
jgi:DNA-binding CsgD family transcriptional regulator